MNYFYNAHTHVFTFKNVPDRFGKTFFWGLAGLLSIQKLRKSNFFRVLLKLMRSIKKSDADGLDRMANFIEHGQGDDTINNEITQSDVFKNLQSYYPKDTKFVALSMDMEFMSAGYIPDKYDVQTKELEIIKNEYPDVFFPFIFADPRRIERINEPFNQEANFLSYLKKRLTGEDRVFAGIKIYPALGYWPFDKRLMDVYDFALDNKIPIMTHCSSGPVYYRGNKEFAKHPIFPEIILDGNKCKEFTTHFSNPINYHMLMSTEIISTYWGEKRDYSKLKICLGHFGGDIEWMKYLQNPWISDTGLVSDPNDYPALKRENWNFNKDFKSGKYTWFSVICDLLEKYDNLYADISSSLEEEKIFTLLKVLLKSNNKIRKKILFGTDYYMVSVDKSERELSIGLRSYLGEKLFEQIALTNVKAFLY